MKDYKIENIVISCIITFLLTFVLSISLGNYTGYRNAEAEHKVPAYPVDQIRYLPPKHNVVYIDANGVYWADSRTEFPSDTKLEDCKQCHGNRWNSIGTYSTIRRLEYWDNSTRYIQNNYNRTYSN